MVGGAIGHSVEREPMTKWPVYCGAHPDLYNIEAVEPRERVSWGRERKHVYRTVSSYDPAGNNALSRCDEKKGENRKRGNRIKTRTFSASTIAFPFPSTHTNYLNSVQHRNPSK